MSLFRRFLRQQRASAAIELALISVFFLVPLFIGALDFVLVLTAQAQLNTALQALYYFAVTTPASAANNTTAGYVINAINTANGSSINQLSLPATTTSAIKLGSTSIPAGTANPSTYYACYTTPASSSSTSFSSVTYQSSACGSSQTQQVYVIYQVTGHVSLPVPLPGRGSTISLSASGSIQTQ
ncbi:MAG: hypothetical protein PHU07_03185 [Acidocella sp.]|nr:hypothetical protein [Acidocella sp.]